MTALAYSPALLQVLLFLPSALQEQKVVPELVRAQVLVQDLLQADWLEGLPSAPCQQTLACKLPFPDFLLGRNDYLVAPGLPFLAVVLAQTV
jgi:hypothetical protein